MKHVLKLTLILWPLLTLSQEVSIDLNNQTVTLDKEKTIEVAKIITNEVALRSYISSLHDEIQILVDSIQSYGERAAERTKMINRLAQNNDSLFFQLLEARKDFMKPAKDESRGVYFHGQAQGNQDAIYGASAGLGLVTRKNFYTVGVDPFFQARPVILLGIGFKLF